MTIFTDIFNIWQQQHFAMRTVEHLKLFFFAISISVVVGVSLGFLLTQIDSISTYFFNILNIIETTPTLALLVLLIPLVGIGTAPTIIASVMYCILPIARNTYEGLVNVDPNYISTARAIGLSDLEILLKVRLPLSFPFIAAGIRIASVFTFGIVTIGGLIAAGGLGQILQVGFYRQNTQLVLVAGLWIGFLAILVDSLLSFLQNYLERRFAA